MEVVKQLKYSQQITTLTEDIEELKSRKRQIMKQLGCENDATVKSMDTTVADIDKRKDDLEKQKQTLEEAKILYIVCKSGMCIFAGCGIKSRCASDTICCSGDRRTIAGDYMMAASLY